MPRLSLLFLCVAIAGCVVQPPPGPLPKYTIFFTEWSARIDDPAMSTISAAAAAAKANPTVPVTVTGFADPTGGAEANRDISQLRAQMVADQLIADGVDRARIVNAARGATGFTQSSQESRRVTIGIGVP